MESAIEVKHLSKKYEDFSLRDISFTLPKGSVMGFIGENGAGKTTTIKAMLKIILRNSGEVKFFGLDVDSDEKAIKERIGVVFDESCFHDTLTPKQLTKIMENVYENWDANLFAQYLTEFKLPEKKHLKDFSRGMKMKLGIAVALSHKADLLILDEATAGLDPIMRDEILDIFLDFIEDEGHAIFISSHITSDLEKIADYITFIHQGEIIFTRTRDEIRRDLGVIRCELSEFEEFDKRGIVRFRKHRFGYEMLIENKQEYLKEHPGISIESVTLESIMLFYARGSLL